MRYVLIGVALAMGFVLSVALVVRSLQAIPDAPEPQQVAAAPAETAPAPAVAEAPAPAPAQPEPPAAPPVRAEPEPQPAKPELPVAAQLPFIQRPEPIRQQPPVAALQPAPAPQAARPDLAPGARLSLNEEQRGRLRDVLLTHNVMQTETPSAPLKVGATIPEDVVLSPLPIEIADAVPAYSRYSYVIAQDRIAIVRNERREIEALIPF